MWIAAPDPSGALAHDKWSSNVAIRKPILAGSGRSGACNGLFALEFTLRP